MPKYRKKPVIIEARRVPTWSDEPDFSVTDFVHESVALAEWAGGRSHMLPLGGTDDFHEGIHIPTLEGTMVASAGDWIIKGVAGEFYPCKPDIFDATYEYYDEAPV